MECATESVRGSVRGIANRRGVCCAAEANERASGRLATFRAYRGLEAVVGPEGGSHHDRRASMVRVEEDHDVAGFDCDENPVRGPYLCNHVSVR